MTGPAGISGQQLSAESRDQGPAAFLAERAVQGTVGKQADAGELAVSDTSGGYARARLTGLTARADSDMTLSWQVGSERQWLRLGASGSTIQYKTWVDGQVEPSTWRGSVTDTSVTAAGQVFVSLNRGCANTGAKSMRFDDLSVS